jgi:adenine-specific DNA-methyltransferase
MLSFLSDSADIARIGLMDKLPAAQRSELGQFLTPAPIAQFMAQQFDDLAGDVSILDPGAGLGALTSAVVERLLENAEQVNSCLITAYEVEATFLSGLEQCLAECCSALQKRGIKADYLLHHQCFIEASATKHLPLFNRSAQADAMQTRSVPGGKSPQFFTHAILNPPYKKISSQSRERQILTHLGIETTNLYSAFTWLAMSQLVDSGELVAITPRSFCNGSYFRPFRKALLAEMGLGKIHIFESRSSIFADDNVLQENIIFYGVKGSKTPVFATITRSSTMELAESLEIRLVPAVELVSAKDPEQFIHIVANSLENMIRVQIDRFTESLSQLDLDVSTGPVVDFRLKSSLRGGADVSEENCLDADRTVPLLYPEAVKFGQVVFPPDRPRKPIGIEKNEETTKWLIPAGWYVLTKRFSSKEEKRRMVAALCPPLATEEIGIENHLNYYHAGGQGIEPDLARGLTAFLNSTLFDKYFRQFSGHTQVNATDLRRIRYPAKSDLISLGQAIGDKLFDQAELDELIHIKLSIMPEAINAIQASQKIEAALAILKSIAAPKEQQNERSALSLLALADLQPSTTWNKATAPTRGITEMMDWFRDHYGKQYAPNTRETVRRQTMHQFVQMGLVVENPDQPDRPINSPKWCYQLHQSALSLLQSYESKTWEKNCTKYRASVINALQQKSRNLSMIPVLLPSGQNIQLSAGGQNNLIQEVVENFCPRFTPGGMVLYLGDAGDKFVVNETKQLQSIGIDLDPHGKTPDVIVYHQSKNWLVLIEAVTSHGPVNLKRHNELKQLFQGSSKGLVFVTAFPDRQVMAKYLAEISWETEVWVADNPEHMIHFNGDRFLGPY